ncbi:MAG TPA: hypothetical protein VEI57_06265 [Nitrospirota bacterium]|nr:hypothetical protein [Nitrospirota bacterium]
MNVKNQNQRGVSLVAAVFIIVILAFLGTMFLTVVIRSDMAAVNDLQSTQALYVAEGGEEYALATLTFPNYAVSTNTNLGSGYFTVATPAITSGLTTTTAATINVNSTANFPASGRIVIDSEVIAYTAKTAIQFNGTVTRGADGTTATLHASGNSVYPVTTVSSNPGTVNPTSISVASTTGFSIPGVIQIGSENIYCSGTSGGNTFTNCVRGYDGTTNAGHAAGSDVFQYMITSTGTVGSAQREVRAGLQQTVVAATGIA